MKQKIEIINVIEINKGIVDAPTSFVIINGVDKDKIVKKAEKLFVKLATEHGMDSDEKELSLDTGSYDNMGSYEVVINWSTVKK